MTGRGELRCNGCAMRKIVAIGAVFLVLLLALGRPNEASASSLDRPFTATCKDTGVHAFRYGVSRKGVVDGRGWSEGEKFLGGEWTFRWAPPDTLT